MSVFTPHDQTVVHSGEGGSQQSLSPYRCRYQTCSPTTTQELAHPPWGASAHFHSGGGGLRLKARAWPTRGHGLPAHTNTHPSTHTNTPTQQYVGTHTHPSSATHMCASSSLYLALALAVHVNEVMLSSFCSLFFPCVLLLGLLPFHGIKCGTVGRAMPPNPPLMVSCCVGASGLLASGLGVFGFWGCGVGLSSVCGCVVWGCDLRVCGLPGPCVLVCVVWECIGQCGLGLWCVVLVLCGCVAAQWRL